MPDSLTQTAEVGSAEKTLGKRERNKLDKQRRIIAAATELFQRHGFERTTTAEIAARAGVGAGTLYLYVESKEDLLVSVFSEVARQAWADGFELVDPDDTVIEQLMTVFGHVTDHHEADRRLSRAFFKELPFVSPSVRSGTEEFMSWFYGRLEALLDETSASGKLDSQVPRNPLAHNLFALWQNLMRRLSAGDITRDEMLEQLETNVRVGLWRMTAET